jgi:hypothetical protein
MFQEKFPPKIFFQISLFITQWGGTIGSELDALPILSFYLNFFSLFLLFDKKAKKYSLELWN